MASIDDLLKGPSSKSTGPSKRKFEAPDAQQAYKATKLSSTSSPSDQRNGQATVEDENDDDDFEAGPALPPDDEDEGDDEEGRFFGGGVSGDTAEALDYIDGQEGEGEYKDEKIDAAWVKRTAASFEKKEAKNAELRARYESEPAKFMASEAELDEEVKTWSLLSEHAVLYPEFVRSGSAGRLVGLLAHENTDIAIGAIEIMSELLDEDVEAEEEDWNALARGLLEADLLDLLMSNLKRLDEGSETDRSGVYHSLSVMEALAGQQSIAEQIGSQEVLTWLCERIQKPEKQLSQNKQYAAEVLQVLLQSSSLLRKRLAGEKIDGVDLFLQILSLYRKRDPPKDTPEEEYVENVFDALTCVLDEREGKQALLDNEGTELLLIMLKEGGFSKTRALRALDHALGSGNVSEGEDRDVAASAVVAVCTKFVEAGGLKTVFSLFSKKPTPTVLEHLFGIFASLLRWLPGESAERIRTLNKFVEKEHEKLKKLVQLRESYGKRLGAVDEEISLERRMMDEEDWEEREAEWLSRRLDGGLYGLQTIDVVLAWLVAEDASVKALVVKGLGSLDPVQKSLKEQLEGVDDEDTKEMFSTLLGFLE